MDNVKVIKSDIVLISGERNAGKTRFCMALANELIMHGNKVTGLISPGVYEGREKIAINSENIDTGELRMIARFQPGWDKENPQREWDFISEGMTWANAQLGSVVPTDFLIIDEIGYLELEKGVGWYSGLQALEAGEFKQAFVVIRKDLLPIALQRWSASQVLYIDKNSNIKECINKILRSNKEK